MNKINYINFIVSDGSNNGKSIQLDKINLFDFKNDNSLLINSLKEIKTINQVIIDKSTSIDNINKLLSGNKNITSIVIRNDQLTKNELNLLMQIKNLKYLILDEKIIKENNLNEEGYQFNIIPKKYFINATDMPWIYLICDEIIIS